MTKPLPTTANIRLPKDQAEFLDRLMERHTWTLSDAIRYCIKTAQELDEEIAFARWQSFLNYKIAQQEAQKAKEAAIASQDNSQA